MHSFLYLIQAMLVFTMSTSSSHILTSLIPQNPLPPCASYIDCSSGTGRSYNFMPEILSATNCQEICERDTQCRFYSYNHSTNSPHYLHCYLSTGCDGGQSAQGWVSGPSSCDSRTITSTDDQSYSHSLLRATRWGGLCQNLFLIIVNVISLHSSHIEEVKQWESPSIWIAPQRGCLKCTQWDPMF